MAAVLALGSAMTWGIADFLGGMTSRRASELVVATLSQIAGVLVLVVVLPIDGVVPSTSGLAWGALAGIGGAGGLAAYFRALAIGPMGVTAPIAALVGAVVPISVGLAAGERPGTVAVVGMGVGLVAVVLASRPAEPTPLEEIDPTRLRWGLLFAAAAGLLFGLFFVALDAAPDDSGLWPLLGARASGVALLGLLVARRRPRRADRRTTWIALGSGVLDMIANTLFLLATREGLLVLVSVLVSLYPVGVVLLARAVLGERLGRAQRAGVVLSLVAVGLIAA